MTEERDIKEDLKPNYKDRLHGGARILVAATPILGGPLLEFFSMVIAPPLEKRRDAWLIEIYTRLKRLEEQVEGFKIENLAQNEKFISTFFYATNVAMRTHQKEKLDALRNAITNSLLHPDVDESQQLMYLNLIDRYSPWHLRLLQFFNEFQQNSGSHDANRSKITILNYAHDAIDNKFPELIGNQDFYEQIVKELVSHGLLEITTSYGRMMTNQKVVAFEITEIGKKFLNFIATDKP